MMCYNTFKHKTNFTLEEWRRIPKRSGVVYKPACSSGDKCVGQTQWHSSTDLKNTNFPEKQMYVLAPSSNLNMFSISLNQKSLLPPAIGNIWRFSNSSLCNVFAPFSVETNCIPWCIFNVWLRYRESSANSPFNAIVDVIFNPLYVCSCTAYVFCVRHIRFYPIFLRSKQLFFKTVSVLISFKSLLVVLLVLVG